MEWIENIRTERRIAMSLRAYAHNGNLEKIVKDNGIEIPGLRGYRLMKDEAPATKEEIEKTKKEFEIRIVERLCTSEPFWNPDSSGCLLDSYTDYLKDLFLFRNYNNKNCREYTGIRWNRIHGWKRKILKYEIKKQNQRIQKQFDMWNKYAGKDNVLYIHSRLGGHNWKDFDGKQELISQPWFLDRVEESFDSEYCDFYAQITI